MGTSDQNSPESRLFTEGGIYVGGARGGHSECEGEVGAGEQKVQENRRVVFSVRSFDFECMGGVGVATPLGGEEDDHKQAEVC